MAGLVGMVGGGGSEESASELIHGFGQPPLYFNPKLFYCLLKKLRSRSSRLWRAVSIIRQREVIKYRSGRQGPGIRMPFLPFGVSLRIPSWHITEMISGVK